MLENLILSGRIVDIALAFLIIEIVILVLWRRSRGSGLPTSSLLINAAAGGSLMLALRAALTGAGWHWTATFLVCALLFHVADVANRWQPESA